MNGDPGGSDMNVAAISNNEFCFREKRRMRDGYESSCLKLHRMYIKMRRLFCGRPSR